MPLRGSSEDSPPSARPAADVEVPPPHRLRDVVRRSLPAILLVAAALGTMTIGGLPSQAKLSLFAFAAAVILWSTTQLDVAYVGVLAMLIPVSGGAVSQERLFEALASDVVWLMIGAFVLGAAILQTGLGERLTRLVVSRARTVGQVMWLVTATLVPLSFLIPSTSGRAALTIPVLRGISGAVGDRRVIRALSLLMPTVILTSTICSLVGAGSHLIVVDLLDELGSERLSFSRWALYGMPFGVVASLVACGVISSMFLTKSERHVPLRVPPHPPTPLTRAEWTTLGVVLAMVVLWLTGGSIHPLKVPTVAVLGVVVLTAPRLGVMSWKDAVASVSWNLVLFVGAALVLGRSLDETGAARWITGRAFSFCDLSRTPTNLGVVLGLSVVGLTSHAYMTSHSARTASLLPVVIALALGNGLDPTAMAFLATVGIDYCLTFPVSSKALLMFQDMDGETYRPVDLLRLSAVLLPLHLILMVAFYYSYWSWVGLRL